MKYTNFSFLISILFIFTVTSCAQSFPSKSERIKKLQAKLQDGKIKEEEQEFPSHDPSIVTGAEIYKANCASCHSANPKAGFLTIDYMRSRTPRDQYLAITNGKGNMPAFAATLRRDQRWDALMYLRSEILGYYSLGSDELSKMETIFGGNCAVCHGKEGYANGPLHKSLYPLPANFNQFSRLYTRSDEKLFQEITHGIPWTAMPAWKNRIDFDLNYNFDEKLIRQLVRYVRQFGYSLEEDRLDKGRSNLIEYKKQIGELN